VIEQNIDAVSDKLITAVHNLPDKELEIGYQSLKTSWNWTYSPKLFTHRYE